MDIQNAVIAKGRLNSTNDLSKVKDWINQVYADVVVETESNVTSATMTMTADTAAYTLPSAVSRIKQMFVTPVGSVQTQPLRMTTLNNILTWRQAGGGTAIANGTVQYYAMVGLSDFEVYPTPGNADVITIYYTALPTALSADSDSPSSIPEPYASKVLEYGALAEAADWKGDPSEQEYRQLFEMWKQKFRAHLTRLEGGQPGQFSIYPARVYPPHDPSTDTGL